METFEQYINNLLSIGESYFTTDKILKDLSINREALRSGIYRLRKKKKIVNVGVNDLYIIIPPRHRRFGCLPAEEVVPILMEHLGLKYYACLLTAAMYHGASHQKPQVFQVMTNKQLKYLTCGRIRIEFVYKKLLDRLPIENMVVNTGYLEISSPELTALDLLLYPLRVGGINNIATILCELVEAINVNKLIKILKVINNNACVQRLGYILEQVDTLVEAKKNAIITKLNDYLRKQRLYYVPLVPEVLAKGFARDSRWKIIENTAVESDI
jgi:predicted transcriptional regulator of viral defense system